MTHVLFKDLRAAGVCKDAGVLFFVPNGLDWRSFCRNGIDARVLLATGDPRVPRVVEAARQREEAAKNGS